MYQASTPWASHHDPIVSIASSMARAIDSRAIRPVALDERRQLVPPAGHEPAVPPGRPAATDVRLEDDDPCAGCLLGQMPGGPEARVAAAEDDDVGRDAPKERRRGRGQVAALRRPSASRSHHDRRVAAGTDGSEQSVSSPAPMRSSRTTSSTVTGLGTRPRLESGSRSKPSSRLDRSRQGRLTPGAGPAMTRWSPRGPASCASRAEASSGTATIAASSPASGSAAIASMARRVALTKAAMASRFDSSVLTPEIRPGPGQWRDVVDP